MTPYRERREAGYYDAKPANPRGYSRAHQEARNFIASVDETLLRAEQRQTTKRSSAKANSTKTATSKSKRG